MFFCLGTFILLSLSILSNFKSVFAQYQPSIGGTTANVSVLGYLENILVWHNPVNFSTPAGRSPGAEWPKVNADGVGYIIINMSDNTNIIWDLYMNASDLLAVSGGGQMINPSQMEVWGYCGGSPLSPIALGNDLTQLCNDLSRYASANISFNLTIPVAQYNDTYNGDLWIYVNSSAALPGEGSNRTWYGPGNTTVIVHQYIEFLWNTNTTPIDFATLSPGILANATIPNGLIGGFPANLTNGGSNIYIDIYIMGTDLECLNPADACWGTYNISIGLDGNLTYSNATSNTTWPDTIKFTDYSYQTPPYEGDFANWNRVPNYTDVSSFWNISIPTTAQQGSYGGDITAKAVDKGTAP